MSDNSRTATLHQPPYYAVIFTSTMADDRGYAAMAERMDRLAAEQPGYLGIDSARSGIGITISYWRDLESIRQWKTHANHLMAQQLGRERFYRQYTVRIARVEREYDFDAERDPHD